MTSVQFGITLKRADFLEAFIGNKEHHYVGTATERVKISLGKK